MESARYGAGIVTAGYTLLLLFTTGVAATCQDAASSIKGIVTNGVTGERLRKAYVRLAPVSNSGHIHPAVTDEEGRFAFDNILPGNYSLEAEHQGLMEGKYGEEAGAPIELRVVAGQNLSDVNIRLMPPAVISGRVRDEDGDLWTHAHIDIYRSVWEGGKRKLEGFNNAELDDAGEFRSTHLPAGRYFLVAEPDAYWEGTNRAASAPRLQPTWYPSSRDSSSATPLTVRAGQELTGVEIRLRRNSVYKIRGKVSGLEGIPALPGPTQWMAPRLTAWSVPRETGGNSQQGSLKSDGSFELAGVVPGTWQIRIEQGLLGGQMALGVATVQIDDHDIEGVSLTVHAPHQLKGVVRIEGTDEPPPAGVSLWLDSPDDLFWDRNTAPRQDGSFDFENIPSGRYRVHLARGISSRYYIKRVRFGNDSSETEFSISADGDALEVTLSSRGAQISGVIKRDGASGSTTPQVVLLPDTADAGLRRYDTHLGTLDQSGAFAVKEPLRPGEYTLYAFEGVPDGAWTDAEFIKEVEDQGIRIKVDEGDAKTVEVPLIPRSELAALLRRLGMD